MTAKRFIWTFHALERLHERGLTREMVEQTVRDGHPVPVANKGDADWRIDAARFVVLYDQPVDGDVNAIRIITAWPKRRKRRRHLRSIPGETERYPEQ